MPLLPCISYQICKASSVFASFFSSDIPPMKAMLDLLPVPGKKGFSKTKLAVLLAEILCAAAVVWFASPFICNFLASDVPCLWAHVRSSTAPPFLFVAVNFIILTIWKLSESRALYIDRSPEEDIYAKVNIIPFRPRDLGSTHAVHLLQNIPLEGCFKMPSISSGRTRLLDYAGEESSPAPTFELSCVTTESEQNPLASPSPIGLSVPEPALAAMILESKEETALHNRDEGDSLDTTWNAIIRKSGRWEPSPLPAVGGWATARVSVAKPTPGNALSDANDEMNQRFDDFIKKSYDQIRLRKTESRAILAHQQMINL